MFPAVHCPDGFIEGGPGCYLFMEVDPMTLAEGETACNKEGGSLAYPNTLTAVSQLGAALEKFRNDSGSNNETPLLVGVNSRLGDFTAGTLYPDAQNLELEKTSNPYYSLASAGNEYELAGVDGTDVSEVSSTGAVCQWPGVIGEHSFLW
ncbi:C-type lectin fold [Trinorchestia longiramus]|nr:C-type lectin fold [Trinorchestia longiramus]